MKYLEIRSVWTLPRHAEFLGCTAGRHAAHVNFEIAGGSLDAKDRANLMPGSSSPARARKRAQQAVLCNRLHAGWREMRRGVDAFSGLRVLA